MNIIKRIIGFFKKDKETVHIGRSVIIYENNKDIIVTVAPCDSLDQCETIKKVGNHYIGSVDSWMDWLAMSHEHESKIFAEIYEYITGVEFEHAKETN